MGLFRWWGARVAEQSNDSLWQGLYSLQMDGVNESVAIGNPLASYAGTEAITYGMWLKIASRSGTDVIIGNGTAFQNRSPILVYTDADNSINAGAFSYLGSLSRRTITFSFGDWHFLTVTKAAGTGTVVAYLDGASAGSAIASAGTMNNTIDQTVGGATGTTGACSAMSVRDLFIVRGYECDLSFHQGLYNSGSVKDFTSSLEGLGTARYYWEFGATGDDATSGTGVIQDLFGTLNGTPANTESGDLVADVP